MSQQPLITRLKAVEKALESSLEEFNGLPHSLGYDFTHKPKIEATLSDLRKLIKEVEGQKPVGVIRKDSEADVYWWLIERNSSREVKRGQRLYTALGEKP